MQKKSKGVAFILSFFVPGAGHMYIGANQLGLKFMAAFFASIAFIHLLPLILPFVVAIIWFYAMFDVLQRTTVFNARIDRQYRQKDATSTGEGWDPVDLDVEPVTNVTFPPLWIGIALIAFGGIVLLNAVAPWLWHFLYSRHIMAALFGVLVIWLGVWLIRNQMKHE